MQLFHVLPDELAELLDCSSRANGTLKNNCGKIDTRTSTFFFFFFFFLGLSFLGTFFIIYLVCFFVLQGRCLNMHARGVLS